jgi:hypothetical protein
MHVPINVKSPNNISEWQMGFNSAFKGLTLFRETGGVRCENHIKHINKFGNNQHFLKLQQMVHIINPVL